MDAILTDIPPSAGSARATPRARLPGEEDHGEAMPGPAVGPADRPAPPTKTEGPTSSRKMLLVGTAAIMLLAGIGGGAYLERGRLATLPFFHHDAGRQRPALIAGNDVVLPAPARPSGTGPAGDRPVPGAAEMGAKSGQKDRAREPAVASPASPATPKAIVPTVSPQQVELNEITALHPATAPARSASATPAAVPRSPEATPAAPGSSVVAAPDPADKARFTGAPSGGAPAAPTAQQVTPSKALPPSTPPSVRSADPVATATTLQAAPMAPPQQVDLLHLMTEMAVVVRDLRTENGQLRSEVEDLTTRVDSQMTQFDRRLSLAEAKGAMAAAMGAGQPDDAPPAVDTGKHPAPAAPAPPPLIRSVKDYRIQAASPRLAMLTFAGSPDGDPSSIQVSIGDDVPGVGRIRSIFQRGSTWVIQTDHGVIQ